MLPLNSVCYFAAVAGAGLRGLSSRQMELLRGASYFLPSLPPAECCHRDFYGQQE